MGLEFKMQERRRGTVRNEKREMKKIKEGRACGRRGRV
jgi:hypothetical protein